ncbi:MAG: efflux RND transporter periplasmic adaptor subunit [Kiritimatiellia bacterium]
MKSEIKSTFIEEIGILEPRELARIQSPIDGTISEVAEDGSRVVTGERLLRLDDEDLRTNLENQLTNLDQQRENLENELAEYAVLTNSFQMTSKLKQVQLAQARLELETGSIPLPPRERRLREIEIELARLDLEDKQSRFERDKELVEKNFAPPSSLQTAERELEAARIFLKEKENQLILDSMPLPEEERLTLLTAVKKAEEEARRNQERQNRDLRIQDLRIEGMKLDIQHTGEEVDKIQRQLQQVVLNAPTGGILRLNQRWVWSVSAWMPISTGQQIRDLDVIGTIVDPKDLSLRVIVHESDFPLLETGQKITARLTSFPDEILTGRVGSVTSLGQDRDDLSPIYRQDPPIHQAFFLVHIELDALSDLAIPGMTALTRIEVGPRKPQVLLSRKALRRKPDGSFEVVRKRGGERETVPVQGTFRDEEWFEVESGLEPGDQVQLPEVNA